MTSNSTCTECNIKKDITANNLCNICSAISISRQTIYNDKRRASRIALINNIDPLMVQLAWAFVILRIFHSLVQLTINIVLLRFAIFATGWFIIAYMAVSQLI